MMHGYQPAETSTYDIHVENWQQVFPISNEELPILTQQHQNCVYNSLLLFML